jgi:hypothetical protein
MGGYDIFVTERIGADKWVKPVNMGYPLNTTDDDLFFALLQLVNMLVFTHNTIRKLPMV